MISQLTGLKDHSATVNLINRSYQIGHDSICYLCIRVIEYRSLVMENFKMANKLYSRVGLVQLDCTVNTNLLSSKMIKYSQNTVYPI